MAVVGRPGRREHTVDVAVPDDPEALRALGASLLKTAGVEASSYGAYRQSPKQLNVYAFSFLKSTQLKYFIDQKKLTVEDRRFRFDQFLTGMHARGGFDLVLLATAGISFVFFAATVGVAILVAGVDGHKRAAVPAE